jgi:hypothetical protein
MSRTQAEYYAYTPRTQFNSKEVREQITLIFIFTDTEQRYILKYRYKISIHLKSEIDDISTSLMIMSK